MNFAGKRVVFLKNLKNLVFATDRNKLVIDQMRSKHVTVKQEFVLESFKLICYNDPVFSFDQLIKIFATCSMQQEQSDSLEQVQF